MNAAALSVQLREIFFLSVFSFLPFLLLSFSFVTTCSGLHPAATSSCPLADGRVASLWQGYRSGHPEWFRSFSLYLLLRSICTFMLLLGRGQHPDELDGCRSPSSLGRPSRRGWYLLSPSESATPAT